MPRNVEIKTRCADLSAIRAIVRNLCGTAALIEEQCDTYFRVPHGRLKLREIAGRPAVLIGYFRPDDPSARTSEYRLIPAPDPDGLKATLAAALGVRGVVQKRREIYLWKNVRIHLDSVAGLGDFIEFEAVLEPHQDEAAGRALLSELSAHLRLESAELLAPSYSDLLGF